MKSTGSFFIHSSLQILPLEKPFLQERKACGFPSLKWQVRPKASLGTWILVQDKYHQDHLQRPSLGQYIETFVFINAAITIAVNSEAGKKSFCNALVAILALSA